MGFDCEIREQVLWLIRNHMKALDLKVMPICEVVPCKYQKNKPHRSDGALLCAALKCGAVPIAVVPGDVRDFRTR